MTAGFSGAIGAASRRLATLCAAAGIATSLGAVSGFAGATPALAYACTDYGWQYDVNTTYGSVHHDSGPDIKNYNGTPYAETMTITSQSQGTVTVTVTVSGTFNINSIIAGAQLTTSVALAGSYSWSYSNQIAMRIPAYRYGNAIDGAWMWKTYGHYYYLSPTCAVSNSQYITTYVPENASGWRTWISTT